MKQIYEMIIFDSGGEDVRLGETVQPDCVIWKLEIKQIKFSSYVRAAYGHRSLFWMIDRLFYLDNILNGT